MLTRINCLYDLNIPTHFPSADGKDTDNRYWVAKTWPPVNVYCEMGSDLGWTVIMRRKKMDVSFNRTWDEYKNGFGNMTGGYIIFLVKLSAELPKF